MMSVGIDVVDVSRFENLLATWPQIADRVFTGAERLHAVGSARPAEHLAARFAAKEATFKALGLGWPRLSWRDVQVVSDVGRPKLVLCGKALTLAGDRKAMVSLAHDGGVAIAQVVLAP